MRRGLKQIALTLAHAVSRDLHGRLADAYSGVGAILMMHRVVTQKSESPAVDLTVTTAFLEDTLTCLREGGVEFLPLSELRRRLAHREAFDRRAIALTFDDGYRDNLTLALPILRKHAAPATIFVPSGAPDRTMDAWFLRIEKAVMRCDELRPDEPALPAALPSGSAVEKRAAYESLVRFVHRNIPRNRIIAEKLLPRRAISDEALMAEKFASWAGLREASSDPLLTFGGHSVSHPVLADLSESDAFDEIAQSRDRMERELQRTISAFAYPYGGPAACGEREFALAKAAGYSLAVTTRYGSVRPRHRNSLFALPRMALGGSRENMDALALDVFGAATLNCGSK